MVRAKRAGEEADGLASDAHVVFQGEGAGGEEAGERRAGHAAAVVEDEVGEEEEAGEGPVGKCDR